MVPLGTLVKVEKRLGPQIIPRYNLYPSASITGEAGPGLQLGPGAEAHGADGRAASCPPAMGIEWTGMSYQEKRVGVAGALRLRPGGADGLPRPGRPVRELAAARRGDPGRPAGPAGHGGRRRRSAAWTTTSTRRSASC